MKILTTVRRVPDLDAPVSLNDDMTEIETEALDHATNYFDEVAVEAAIRLKEAGNADEVVSVCFGSAESTKTIRTAMAMGADRGILVELDEKEVDSYLIAEMLTKVVEREEPDLIIIGKLGVDFENNQVAQLLAGMLNWPQGTFAYSLEVTDDGVKVGREIDGGTALVQLPLPAIVTADLRLNEPRFPSLPGIMKAKRKPLDQLTPEDLEVELEPRVKTLRFEMPEERAAGVILETVEELVDKLKNEAKVV